MTNLIYSSSDGLFNPLPLIIGVLVAVVFLFIFIAIIKACIRIEKQNEVINQMSNLLEKTKWHKLKDYINNKKNEKCPGIYVFMNNTKNKAYVGQSVNVYKRVCDHTNGRSNCFELAEDMGTDDVVVTTILLKNTDYIQSTRNEIKHSLDQLEQKMIFKYHSTENGYNKVRGSNVKSNPDFKWLYKKKKRRRKRSIWN